VVLPKDQSTFLQSEIRLGDCKEKDVVNVVLLLTKLTFFVFFFELEYIQSFLDIALARRIKCCEGLVEMDVRHRLDVFGLLLLRENVVH